MVKVVGRILSAVVWLGLWAMVVLLIVFPLATSAICELVRPPNETTLRWVDFLQNSQVLAFKFFIFAWVAFVGSCFASFLNLVAWRVPRGQSILGASHCPQCNIKLKFGQTNTPVLGWFRNGGRCVNCEMPIPARYLVAELVLGATFLSLFLVQTYSLGETEPFLQIGPTGSALIDQHLDMLVLTGFHLTVLSIVFTLSIAATEKFNAPTSIVIFGVVAAIGFQLAPYAPGIPDYRFGDWENGSHKFGTSQPLKLIESPEAFSIAVGLGVAAAAISFLAIRYSKRIEVHGVFASLLLLGVFLGWQAVVSVTIFFLFISLPLRLETCSIVFVAAFLHLCSWRLQAYCQWWPGPTSGLQQLVAGVGYAGVLAALCRFTATTASETQLENEGTINLPASDADLE